ncbi:hypothetical protein LC55x_0930 [Lysobacter capsici]|nr:hypothetical protein LC55x_0930 [Lysobacter capsici]
MTEPLSRLRERGWGEGLRIAANPTTRQPKRPHPGLLPQAGEGAKDNRHTLLKPNAKAN